MGLWREALPICCYRHLGQICKSFSNSLDCQRIQGSRIYWHNRKIVNCSNCNCLNCACLNCDCLNCDCLNCDCLNCDCLSCDCLNCDCLNLDCLNLDCSNCNRSNCNSLNCNYSNCKCLNCDCSNFNLTEFLHLPLYPKLVETACKLKKPALCCFSSSRTSRPKLNDCLNCNSSSHNFDKKCQVLAIWAIAIRGDDLTPFNK